MDGGDKNRYKGKKNMGIEKLKENEQVRFSEQWKND
jgi:hypothetical protein